MGFYSFLARYSKGDESLEDLIATELAVFRSKTGPIFGLSMCWRAVRNMKANDW